MGKRLTLETKKLSPHELKLVRGTYQAMARIGTQQLSLRRIAKEMDVSPALLAYHFRTRDNLLVETIHWALAATVRRIKQRVDGIADPLRALSALIDAVFIDPQSNRDFHLVYLDLVQYSVRQPSFTGLASLLRDHIDASYAAVIQQGVDAGVFHVDDINVAARHARAIVEGGFSQWIQEEDWEKTHDRLRDECHAAMLLIFSHQPASKLSLTA